ncbi:MAG: SUMF1/EgtB/PvdO family nonheme iron enzyme [Isosphaeraceae bacterium]
MIRGGSWNNEPGRCRSANRNRNTPENRNNNLGFRLVLAQQTWWIPRQTEPTAFRSRHPRVPGKRLQARPVLVAASEGSGRAVSKAAGRSPPSFEPLSICPQPAERAAMQ